MKLAGSSMGSKSFCFIPPKIYYVLSKVNEAGKYIVVHRSQSVTGTDPNWVPTTLSMRSLCNGDKDRGLKVECFQEKMSGSHKSLGYCFTTLNAMVSLGTGGIKLLSSHDGRVRSSTFFSISMLIPITIYD